MLSCSTCCNSILYRGEGERQTCGCEGGKLFLSGIYLPLALVRGSVPAWQADKLLLIYGYLRVPALLLYVIVGGLWAFLYMETSRPAVPRGQLLYDADLSRHLPTRLLAV